MPIVKSTYDEEPLNEFSKIDEETDLRSLNLNWREKDLPQKIRTKHVHKLHPYLGKFIPQIVEIFLRKFQPKSVFDPFCGSGTTLVEANSLGIDSYGADISEFNCLLSKIKTDKYDIELLENELRDIYKRVSRFSENRLFKNNNNDVLKSDSEYLNKWYADRARKELLYFKSLISDYENKDILKVVLTRSARSARQAPHYDLDFPSEPVKEPYECYKHGRICTPVDEALKFFKRYTKDTIKRIKQFDEIRTQAEVNIFHENSKRITLPQKVDMVFTSPPYVGLIDYHEQHKYAYELLDLKDREEEEIGKASDGKSKSARKKYEEEIFDVFENCKRQLLPGGRICIVVNDKYDMYQAEKIGMKEEFAINRDVNRRTGRRNSKFSEEIVVWKMDE